MVLACIGSRVKSVLLSIIGIFRRALCCFSRKRSHYPEDEILTGINVQSNYSPKRENHMDRDWNSWDDTPRTVEEHIEKYREQMAQKSQLPTLQPGQGEVEPEPDYFGDMEPTSIKQAKIFIATQAEEEEVARQSFNRLQATVQADIPISNELEDWEEDNPAGWDEINNENTKQLIREKRKELRHQKQKQQHRDRPPNHSSGTFLQAERLTISDNNTSR